jgi:hypothetical protein
VGDIQNTEPAALFGENNLESREAIEDYIFNMGEHDYRPRYKRVIDILEHLKHSTALCDLFSSKRDNEWGKLSKGLQNLINEMSD